MMQGISGILFKLSVYLLHMSLPLYVRAIHHMKRTPPRLVRTWTSGELPLVATNNCDDDIYPGVVTQRGQGPDQTGFKLGPGEQLEQVVSGDWQGRMWGRTNCTFNEDGNGPATKGGKACGSGDCNGALNCLVTACGSAFPG